MANFKGLDSLYNLIVEVGTQSVYESVDIEQPLNAVESDIDYEASQWVDSSDVDFLIGDQYSYGNDSKRVRDAFSFDDIREVISEYEVDINDDEALAKELLFNWYFGQKEYIKDDIIEGVKQEVERVTGKSFDDAYEDWEDE